MKFRNLWILALLLTALLAGCAAAPEEAPQPPATAPEVQPEPEPEPEPEVHPYAWLGLQDMPECAYLDLLSSNRYIQVYDNYVLGVVGEVTEAQDGVNAYTKNQGAVTYTVDGMIYSVNEDTQTYLEFDMTDSLSTAIANMESALAGGVNLKGRAFQGTGSEPIPQYSEYGDDAEYEYYEYMTGSEELTSSVLERFYLKDGDVFAIYTRTRVGETTVESTSVIKSISGDIPEGLIAVPDLSDYEKRN